MSTRTANYYVTLRCNDSCEFCTIWDTKEHQQIEEKPYAVSRLRDLGVDRLNILGGEPLLRPDLPEIVQQAKAAGLHVELTTNGILYPDKARLLSSHVDRLFISLDYPFEEMHDRSRGTECFHSAVKSLKLAQQLGQNAVIKFILTRDSVLYMPEMVDLAEKLHVPVYFIPVYDFHGTQGFEPATINHIKYFFRRRSVLLDLAALEWVRQGGNRVITPRCRAGEATVTILPDGRQVSPCFFNQNGRQGREDICSSCMRWPYMLPSFSKGLDKYFWLNWYSERVNQRKQSRFSLSKV
ncbi:MAG: radical SAM protein [Candidatus Saganbacteria bacterium]|nr:radical SAM protein [Candidatus Saganbacteria bacterium]